MITAIEKLCLRRAGRLRKVAMSASAGRCVENTETKSGLKFRASSVRCKGRQSLLFNSTSGRRFGFYRTNMSEQIEVRQDRSEMDVIFVHSELDDRGLSAAEFRVYCHLARRAGKGTAFPGIRSIAEKCALAGGTVMSAIKSLESSGMITASRTTGQTTRYVLTAKSKWTPLPNLIHPPTVSNGATGCIKPNYATVSNGATKGNPVKVIQEGNPSSASGGSESEYQKFIRLWDIEHQKHFSRKYSFVNMARDGAAVKALLKIPDATAESLMATVRLAWAAAKRDPNKNWWCSKLITIHNLKDNFEKIAAETASKKPAIENGDSWAFTPKF